MTLPPAPDRWTIELANAERADAIAAFGFTERQARFLLNVLLHAGVFVARQDPHFRGHRPRPEEHRLHHEPRRAAIRDADCTGKLHRGRMFHVHYKPLWAAIGEPDSRFRKPNAPGRMIERVMLLDAVLDDREFVWLGPSTDKRRHFVRHLENRLDQLERIRTCCSATVPQRRGRYFPDKLPIGMQPYARAARASSTSSRTRRRWTSGCSCLRHARPPPGAAPLDGPPLFHASSRRRDWPTSTPRGSTWRRR